MTDAIINAANATNGWTLVGELAVLVVLELVLLVLRAILGPRVKTISMVARDYGPRTVSIVYTLSGLLPHFWVNWGTQPWWPQLSFWMVSLGLLAWDVERWDNPVETWHPTVRKARNPAIWWVVGSLAGLVLFPQAA